MARILEIIKELLAGIFMYQQGKKSVEKDVLEERNKKLDEYAKIDAEPVAMDEVYNAKKW